MAAPDFVAPNLYAESIASARTEPRAISRRHFKIVLILAEAAADFLTCAAGFFAANLFCSSLHFGAQAYQKAPHIFAMCAIFGFFVVFLQVRDSAYRSGGGLLRIRETERAIRVPPRRRFYCGLHPRCLAWVSPGWSRSLLFLWFHFC